MEEGHKLFESQVYRKKIWKEFLKGTDMEEELISVIVPVYNVEKYLNRCVDSIVNKRIKI